jgi:hypothetical protein
MSNIINIKKFIDVSTSVSPTPLGRRDFRNILFVQKGDDGAATVVTSYTELESLVAGEGSNTAAAQMATIFWGGGFNGVKPSSTVYVAKIGAATQEEFTAGFTALLSSSDYYLVALDNALSAYTTIAASANEASTIPHYLFCLDTDVNAINKDASEDETSVSAYLFNNKLTRSAAFWTDDAKKGTYPNVAAASFFAITRMSAARPLGNLAYKVISGVLPVDFVGANVQPSQAWDNLASKMANAYITLGETGRTCFQAGTCGSGDNIDEYIAADYLNYTVTYNVYDLLTSVPKLPMNTAGSKLLYRAISSAFDSLNAAGIIGGGVSQDGESFGESGYKISIPIPTGINKAIGLWDGVVCKALLTGSCKKVVIGNDLKK